jgi:hypothetical protein
MGWMERPSYFLQEETVGRISVLTWWLQVEAIGLADRISETIENAEYSG